jgi:hypothetical protein
LEFIHEWTQIFYGNWGVAEYIIEYDEDFETGDFSNLPWEHSGYSPWVITSSQVFEGSYAARSGAAPRYEETILHITLTVEQGDIYFMRKTGSRDGYLQFWVDEDVYGFWDYDLDWALVYFPISAGTHTFKWEYTPGVFGDMVSWIDAIRFPPIVQTGGN